MNWISPFERDTLMMGMFKVINHLCIFNVKKEAVMLS